MHEVRPPQRLALGHELAPQEAELVRALAAAVLPELPAIVQSCVERARQLSEARGGATSVRSLETALSEWLVALCDCPGSAEYLAAAAATGLAVDQLPLTAGAWMTCLSEVRVALLRVGERPGSSAVDARAALLRAFDQGVSALLDAQLATQRASAERARHSDRLAAVGRLATGLAHEIRNPLNGAQLHLAVLERAVNRQASRSELLETTAVVGDELKRLARLVSEFSDFVLPRPLQLARVSVGELCREASRNASEVASSAKVTLSVDVPAPDLELVGDRDKLLQLLAQLLKNAVESIASTSRGGNVSVRARASEDDLVLEVEDDGPGISTPEAPIFDAFFSTKERGTGLGLPIVHRIAADHGGSLEYASRPGRTVFRVLLPLRESQGSEP